MIKTSTSYFIYPLEKTNLDLILNKEYFAKINQVSSVNYQSIFHLPDNFQYIGLPFETDMLTEPFMNFLFEII